MTIEHVLEAHDRLRAAFTRMLTTPADHPDSAEARREHILADVAVGRAALAYAAAPEPPPAAEIGGTFALALHQSARRAIAAGLPDELDRCAAAAASQGRLRTATTQSEIRAAIDNLVTHLEDHAAEQRQHRHVTPTADARTLGRFAGAAGDNDRTLEAESIAAERAAIAAAGGATDGVRIGDHQPRVGGLREHLRQPRWRATIRTVGKSAAETDIAASDHHDELLATAVAAREALPAGCTIDISRRTMTGWAITDTLPSLPAEEPPLTGEFHSGEYVRTGDQVIGVATFDGHAWRLGYPTDAPHAFRVPHATWPTRAAAVAELRANQRQ